MNLAISIVQIVGNSIRSTFYKKKLVNAFLNELKNVTLRLHTTLNNLLNPSFPEVALSGIPHSLVRKWLFRIRIIWMRMRIRGSVKTDPDPTVK